MRKLLWTRRRFLKRGLAAGAFTAVGLTDAIAIEPQRFEITRPAVPSLGLGYTLVHLTDLHYHGNRGFLEEIVRLATAQKPDLVCITGDLMDRHNRTDLPEALQLLATIPAPLFGVPGNHDARDPATQALCREAFARTGGAWLFGERARFGRLIIHGTYFWKKFPPPIAQEAIGEDPTLLLCHFPIVGDSLPERRYDLVLSGHSHGGQVRLPLLPPLVLPGRVGRYVEGYFPEAPVGALYVSRGLGSTLIPLRFCCRPEMPVFRI